MRWRSFDCLLSAFGRVSTLARWPQRQKSSLTTQNAQHFRRTWNNGLWDTNQTWPKQKAQLHTINQTMISMWLGVRELRLSCKMSTELLGGSGGLSWPCCYLGKSELVHHSRTHSSPLPYSTLLSLDDFKNRSYFHRWLWDELTQECWPT